jgi:hypothetical protein
VCPSFEAFQPVKSLDSPTGRREQVELTSCAWKRIVVWNESLKWHTELGRFYRKGNDGEEETVFPEVSADGKLKTKDFFGA